MEFYKYQGTGNDFIIVDNRMAQWSPTTNEVSRLCDRRFGIGADGLILLSLTEGYDFSMTYFNSDGHESTMCGNGGRCIAAFAHFLGLGNETIHFLATDGPHEAILVSAEHPDYHVSLKMKDTSIEKIFPDGIFIDTGSPHFVTFRENVSDLDVLKEG